MKPFDLKKARDGAISTTKGSLKIDNLLYLPTLEDEFKLMGVIDGKLERWTVDGTHWSEDSTMDLALKDESCEAWVNVYRDTKTGVFLAYPERDQVPETIREQLIVELYSK